MDITRVGIIGAGWMAAQHGAVLTALDGVEVSAVCDVDRERAASLAGRTGARVRPDWRDLLDREELDAVFVCVPPLAHREPAVQALRRGLAVYLEKPIARTMPDAAAITEAAEQSGAVCAVGYQWHALSLLGDLREMLGGQPPGLLVGISIGPTESRPWFLDRRAGGGNLLERGSHHLDLIRAVGGEVASVQAAASKIRLGGAAQGGDIDDAVTIMLGLESGALATVVVAWTRPGQPGSYHLDVVAPRATLRLDLDPEYALTGTSDGQQVSRHAEAPALTASVSRFLQAARDHEPAAVACPPGNAAGTLAVAIAAEQALETGRTVTVRPG
jgi:myo-inositol 2-dehydrogenase/D-chiro-inositol 1-dehydrogenase